MKSSLPTEGCGMRLTLPIRWRGAWLNLPLDMEYQVLFGQPTVMAAWMNGADVWPQLSHQEREVLRAHVRANLQQNGCGATQALRAAQRWREAQAAAGSLLRAREGIVIVNPNGSVVGWVEFAHRLEAREWEAGMRAVEVDGTQWLALGGDKVRGADRWELVVGDKPHLPPDMLDIAQEEQEAALAFSEAQKGARHVR